ncbi:MAG TPA: ABC transporter ATP-binding protein [Ilumatobacteraceae bacterium]|nr:ABC transporter ATP-binding protein [Ilumatobacteraceae bacterium]
MAAIELDGVGKVYRDGTRAVSDLNLSISDGEFVVLVGPSGCGKTTALRMVAGLEEISEGTVRIDGTVVNRIDPGKRDIAMVFQNYALYPHMSIFENIAFPLRSQRISRVERRQRVERTAAILGLTELLKKKPSTLSGGQRQRVAMGRAIVREPRLFLMDEPLSNLDAKLRVQMRSEISRIQSELGVTTIYVTHDQVEAMTMGTRIAVMRKGVLQQLGPPQEIYESPQNLFVAAFIGSPGMNFVRATLVPEGGELACLLKGQQILLPRGVVDARPGLIEHKGSDVAIGIRPEHLSVSPVEGPTLSATVLRSEMLGAERLVHLSVDASPVMTDEMVEAAEDVDPTALSTLRTESIEQRVTLIARVDPSVTATVGEDVLLGVNAARLHFFDLETGATIA